MLGGLRKDIQGLRAIAVVAVLLWHVDSATLPGGFAGVDVFFVVSGFLMTSLLAAPSRLGIREIADFYQRRVRRIIPAATVVVVVTAAGAAIRLDPSRWSQVGGDLVAATLFVVNWRFASRSVDYLASVDPPSPVQHYWSLAVEEQFYLLWPLLMAVAVALSHRRRRSAAVAVVSSAVVVASLLASWSLSASSPASAYFVTTTRLWELALGGLAVPLTAWMAGAPKGFRLCLGWLGLTAIAGSFCVIGPDDPFPGLIALLPTLGTAAVIVSGGPGAHPGGPERVLGVAPAQWVGRLSYSIYLWHWPVLQAADPYDRGLTLWSPTAVTVIVVSVALAWLSWRWVEEPARRSAALRRPMLTVALGLGAIALTMSAAVALSSHGQRSAVVSGGTTTTWRPPTSAATGLPAASGLGAEVLGNDPATSPAGLPVDDPGPFVPSPADARNDLPPVYGRGCHSDVRSMTPTPCELGADTGPHLLVVGDSHAAQWLPPLEELAVTRGWRLTSVTKTSCPLTDAHLALDVQGTPYSQCTSWNLAVTPLIQRLRPDAVIVSSYTYSVITADGVLRGSRATEPAAAGFASAWAHIAAMGIPVVVLIDTPAPGFPITACAASERAHLTACSFPRDAGIRRSGAAAQRMALAASPGVIPIDLTDASCPQDQCAAVIGGVLVYRDPHHLTATYAASLASRLDPIVERVLAAG